LQKIKSIKGFVGGALLGAALMLSSAAYAQSGSTSTAQLTQRLFSAVAANNLAEVRSSITAGANITAVNQNGQTAAGLAIEKGYFNIAHYILGIRNQRTALDEDDRRRSPVAPLGTPQAPVINVPKQPGPTPPPITPIVTPPPPVQPTPPPQTVKQWPADKPNPFAPNTQVNSIPIVGTPKKPTVQPELPAQPVRSKISEKTPENAPLKIANSPPPAVTAKPTPIKPLANETVTNGPVSKDKGMIDRMVDGVTGVFKSDKSATPAEPVESTVRQTKEQSKDDQDDGFIDRMWNSITNIF